MKRLSISMLVLCTVAVAQKQTKEEKRKAEQEEQQERMRPRSVTIHATADAIKAELMRSQLKSNRQLCGEMPSKLTFCTTLSDKQRATARTLWGLTDMHLEYIFTLAPSETSVMVIASVDACETNRSGVQNRLREMNKQTRAELQIILDHLKTAVEQNRSVPH